MNPNPQYPGQPPAGPQETSGMAIAALVFGILGICLPCPLGLVGIILGIVALNRIGSTPGLGGRGLAIAGIVVPIAAGVVSIGIYAAIGIPNFIKFQARAKQAECKSNLKAVFTAEKSNFQQKDAYSTSLEEIGFDPERGNRYAYFLFDVGQMQDRSSATPGSGEGITGVQVDTFRHKDERPIAYSDVPPLAGNVKPGVHGQCPNCSFVAVCAGNIDSDPELDVWSISTEDRTGPNGEPIPAGSPFNDVNDVKMAEGM
jgi:type IV pilus assembly protein PilA